MIETYTKKELATIAGYTYRRLYDIDLSLPDDEKLFVKADDGKYRLDLFVQRWVKYNVGREEESSGKSLDDVKAAHEIIKTEKTRLEVARMRGELVDVGDVRRLWGDVANTVMQNMIRLPSKIAPQVIAMDNMEVIAGIIDKEIRDVLTAIADTPIPDYAAQENGQEDDEQED